MQVTILERTRSPADVVAVPVAGLVAVPVAVVSVAVPVACCSVLFLSEFDVTT